jgi:hypothetical protein
MLAAALGIPAALAPDPARAGDDSPLDRLKQHVHSTFHPDEPAPPLTLAAIGHRIDRVGEQIRDDGTVVMKVPDVYSNAKMTKYRKDFERQMSTELGNFKLIIAARTARLDAASTTSATSLGAALAPRVSAPAAPTINLEPYTPPPLPSNIAAQSGVTLGGTTASTGIGLEPTIYLDQEKEFIDHLNEWRRVNMGSDRDESAGYALYLVRLPVSIVPGHTTREGHGAEIAVAVQHQFHPVFLGSTFRNLVINDLVDQLSPVIYEYLRSGQIAREDELAAAQRRVADAEGRLNVLDDLVRQYREKEQRAQADINAIRSDFDRQVAYFTDYIRASDLRGATAPDTRLSPGDAREVAVRLSAARDIFLSLVPQLRPNQAGALPLLRQAADAFDTLAQQAQAGVVTGSQLDTLAGQYGDVLAQVFKLVQRDPPLRAGELNAALQRIVSAPLSQAVQMRERADADRAKTQGDLQAARDKRDEAWRKVKPLMLRSSRGARAEYPVGLSDIPEVFLKDNIDDLARKARDASINSTPRLSDIRNYLRQQLGVAYNALYRTTSDLQQAIYPSPVLMGDLLDRILQAVEHGHFLHRGRMSPGTADAIGGRDVGDLGELEELERELVWLLSQAGFHNIAFLQPLTWAIAVDAALLDQRFREVVPNILAGAEKPCADMTAIGSTAVLIRSRTRFFASTFGPAGRS